MTDGPKVDELPPITGACELCGEPAYSNRRACPECRRILSHIAEDGSILPAPGGVN